MANSDSPISHAVKEAVKQSNETLLLVGSLSPIAIKILEVIKAGGTARDAAKQCGCSKQNVSYWIKRLIQAGLIRLQTRDVFKVYSLTTSGQTIFAGSDSNGEVVVLEDDAVKFRVVENLKRWGCRSCLERKEKCSMPRTGLVEYCTVFWKKLGDPNNWEKLGHKLGSVTVELHTGLGASHTESNVIIHPGKFVGYKPEQLRVDSGMAVQKCKDILELQFQMILSEEGVSLFSESTVKKLRKM